MGSVQSAFSSKYVVPGLVAVGGAAVYLYFQQSRSSPSPTVQTPSSKGSQSKKSKKADSDSDFDKILAAAKAEAEKAQPRVVAFPEIIPGSFDSDASAAGITGTAKEKKNRKKKSKKSATPEVGPTKVDESAQTTPVQPPSTEVVSEADVTVKKKEKKKKTKKASQPVSGDTSAVKTAAGPSGADVSVGDNAWTRVEARRHPLSQSMTGDILTSDTNLTTSVTDSASATTEKTDEDDDDERESDNRRPFVERMLPKPRKLGVEDMEETSLYPTVSRVIRVRPGPLEQPAQGFSWEDYEDVIPGTASVEGTDGDEESGWGVVRNRKRAKNPTSNSSSVNHASAASEAATKKQRQNAAKREAAKADKQTAEALRLQQLNRHKKELEKIKMDEQWKSSKSKLSGGAQAVVTEKGTLIWE